MTRKVSDLKGDELDMWVARAEKAPRLHDLNVKFVAEFNPREDRFQFADDTSKRAFVLSRFGEEVPENAP